MQEGKKAIVIGASAGGLEGLKTILAALPAEFRPPIFIVLHLASDKRETSLPQILAHVCSLPVREAIDKQKVDRGVFTAPANYHLLVDDPNTLSLSVEDPVHFSRPSIDVLFESAADIFGDGLVGIILSGASEDGAAGLREIKNQGGFTIVQDPNEAEASFMPVSAIKSTKVDLILPVKKIGPLLTEMVSGAVAPTEDCLRPDGEDTDG